MPCKALYELCAFWYVLWGFGMSSRLIFLVTCAYLDSMQFMQYDVICVCGWRRGYCLLLNKSMQ